MIVGLFSLSPGDTQTTKKMKLLTENVEFTKKESYKNKEQTDRHPLGESNIPPGKGKDILSSFDQ